jgi:hypothetical protein
MGIIAAIKIGYKTLLLQTLLAVFDEPGAFRNAQTQRNRRRRGCRGINYGGKATVLDAMNLLQTVWKSETRYATTEAIQRCWRKAGILPIAVQADINNDIGSESVPNFMKQISKEDCNELCDLLMRMVKVTSENEGNISEIPPALNESYVTDRASPLPAQEMTEMISNWLTIEDDEVIQLSQFEDAIEKLENGNINEEMNIADNDEDDCGKTNCSNQNVVWKNHFEVEETLTSVIDFLRSNQYPRQAREHIDQAIHKMRLHRVSKRTTDVSLHRFFASR